MNAHFLCRVKSYALSISTLLRASVVVLLFALTAVPGYGSNRLGVEPSTHCEGGLIQNPSFEDGLTGWTGTASGTGTGFAMDGLYYVFLNALNGKTYLYQDVQNVAPNAELELTFYGGSHRPESYRHGVYIEYYSSSGALLGRSSEIAVEYDVESRPPNLQAYTLQVTTPADTSSVRIVAVASGDYLKLDLFCLHKKEGLGSIGDQVWSDPDNDGNSSLDGDDFPISGVVVTLVDSNGNVVATDTTDENGNYLFENLPLGTYTVQIETNTLPDVKQGNPAYDPDGGDDNQSTVTITPENPDNRDQDFAYFQTKGSIGDQVWSDPDSDGNNMLDGDDFPIEGVSVSLFDSDGNLVATDTTDADGRYLFNDLVLGTYTVQIDSSTLPDVKAGNPAYDPDGGDDNQSTVTLTPSEPNDRDQDFAYFQTLGSIGDTIWSDVDDDGNGVIDGDDFPIEGVVVNLYDSSGALVATDTTDANGRYLFDNLPLNETYTVQVDTTTLPDVKQGNPAYDPDGGDDNQSQVTLTADNPNDRDQDFAYFQALGAIGDTIWSDPDQDGNGVIDGDDFPIEGVVVNLYDSSGALVATDTTDTNGKYLFDNLPLNETYTIQVDATTLPDIKQGNPAYDPDGGDDNQSTVTLTTNNPNDRDQDFAYFQTLGSIGDTVWSDPDQDGNGAIDGDDFPLEGVVVNLYDSSGSAIGTQVTDASGQYLFDQLPLNETYTVQIDENTLPDVKQGNPAYDPDGGDDNQSRVTLTADNPNDREQDFAYFQTLGSIGDTIWSDVDDDGNGVIDGDDFPIAGVVVNVYDSSGALAGSDTTDSNGQYLVDQLPLNETYTVQVDTTTLPDVKQGNPAYDPDGGDDNQSAVTLTADNPNDRDQDFAYFQSLGSIGDTIWSDVDDDGNNIIDGDDFPIAGVVVNVYDSSGALVGSDTTDSNGQYLVDQLPLNETYTIQVDTTTLPDVKQVNPAYDPDGGDDNQSQATLTTDNPDDRDQDFAYFQTLGSIGDTIWSDPDDDGNSVIDGDDFPIVGVVVNLYDSNGNLITADVTDSSGMYLFERLPLNSSYTIGVDTSTLPDVKQGNPSYDPDGGDDNQSQVTLTIANPDDRDQDFAYFQTILPEPTMTPTPTPTNTPVPPIPSPTATTTPVALASLGDKVWKDLNDNGQQDSGEPGVSGVTVNLWTVSNGTPDTFLGTMSTTGLGLYKFTGLDPSQDYVVEFVLPDGYQFTSQDGGADDSADSDANKTTGLSHIVELDPGENDPTIDAGIVEVPKPTPTATASLGNRVWKDANKNGIQDSGEQNVDDVVVNLWLATSDGTPTILVDSTTTANGGQYMFTGLTPGQTYVVQLDTSSIPSYCAGLTMPDSGDDVSDSDIDPATGISGPVVLAPGETNTSVDAGLIPTTSSLGNIVWKDANGNGIQDEGEAGVPGVPVTLWTDDDGNGTPDSQIESVRTDQSGVYLFTDLDPNKVYIVEFDMMPTMPYSPQDQGSDESIDSDVDPATGITDPITIAPNENNTDVDAGMTDLPASLGDTVWKDLNGNGLQDDNESGVAGVLVTLWVDNNGDGMADISLQSVETDDQGMYLFTNLDAHMTYIVQVEVPADCTLTDADQGDDQIDSDIDPNTGLSAPITLESGEDNPTIDIGLEPIKVLAALGNFVWLDDNANGTQDEDEPGIAGVTVTLLNAVGQVVGTTTTDQDGAYRFDNLIPGEYSVKFELPSGTYTFTTQDATDESKDSDVDPSTGMTIITELTANENDLKWDAGVIAPPALNIQKEASSEVIQQGGIIDFNIIYNNTGLGTAKGVVITELVPQFTSFVPEQSTPGWRCQNGNISAGSLCTFAIDSLPGGSGNLAELHFVVKVNQVVDTSVKLLVNQIQINDDGSHPSGISGQAVDEVSVVVRHPTSLGSVGEEAVTASQTYLYLPLIRRNLFKEQPDSLLSPGEWSAVWACGVATNPQLQWDSSMVDWATAVCAALGE